MKSNIIDLVKVLENRTRIEKVNGINIRIKEIPDLDEDGVFDTRVYEILI